MSKFDRQTPAASLNNTDEFVISQGNGLVNATVQQLVDQFGANFGDASTDTTVSVDGEMALFSGAGGKTLKRSTLGTGILKSTSGIPAVAVQGTDYYAPAGTDVAVTDGGTGASTAAGARTALGLAIGTDVQAYSARLEDVAGNTYAQGDVLYYNGTNLVNLSAGTVGQFLKTQGAGANPVWASVSGSGTTVWEAVVATSGGDYTTVSAALTAGKKRIWVRNGTYVESTWTLAGNEIIMGESRDDVIIDFGGTNLINMANNTHIERFTVKKYGFPGIKVTGEDCKIMGMRFEAVLSYANPAIRLGGSRRVIIANNLFNNASTTVCGQWIQDSTGIFTGLITNNFFQGYWQTALNITWGSLFRFSNNYCQSTYDQTGALYAIDINVADTLHDCSIENNYIGTGSSASGHRAIRLNTVRNFTVRDNNFAQSTSGISIDVIGATNCYIINNFVITANKGVSIDATSASTYVLNNNLAQATIPISNASNTTVSDNQPLLSTKTASYTITQNDYTIFGDATTAGITITLPTAVGASGRMYVIKKVDASANAVTIGTTSAQTIDGAATIALSTQYDSRTVISNGTNWFLI